MNELTLSELFRSLAREAKRTGNHRLVMIYFKNFARQRKKALERA